MMIGFFRAWVRNLEGLEYFSWIKEEMMDFKLGFIIRIWLSSDD
jgi:hypothetical protein